MARSLVLKSLGNLIDVEEDTTSKVEVRTTKEARKTEWKKAVESFDVDRLLEVQEKMAGFVDRMKVLAKTVGDDLTLSEEEAEALMAEHLEATEILEFLEARKSMVRSLVFTAISQKYEEEGHEDPENVSGSIEVPEFGKRFAKEGCGYKDPTLDLDKLKELLTDEELEAITIREEIPATVKTYVDQDLLVALVKRKPEVLEKVRESLKKGERKSPRFAVRNMK